MNLETLKSRTKKLHLFHISTNLKVFSLKSDWRCLPNSLNCFYIQPMAHSSRYFFKDFRGRRIHINLAVFCIAQNIWIENMAFFPIQGLEFDNGFDERRISRKAKWKNKMLRVGVFPSLVVIRRGMTHIPLLHKKIYISSNHHSSSFLVLGLQCSLCFTSGLQYRSFGKSFPQWDIL